MFIIFSYKLGSVTTANSLVMNQTHALNLARQVQLVQFSKFF